MTSDPPQTEPGSPRDSRELVRAGYDRVVGVYRPEHFGRSVAENDAMYAAWLSEATADVPSDGLVLELGCGDGVPAARWLIERGFGYRGVDASAGMIRTARANVPGAAFEIGDITALQVKPGSCDAVVAFFSIIHLPVGAHEELLWRIATWLRPGGRFAATLGHTATDGSEDDWLGVPGATMYWSHADAATYRGWLGDAGFTIETERLIPEGDGGHAYFCAAV